MVNLLIVILVALAVSGIVGCYLSRIEIDTESGWIGGNSPLARYLDNRRRLKFNEQLPEVLPIMSNALRAGFSISQAFDAVVDQGENPISQEFSALQKQLKVGMSFEDALNAFSARVGSDDLTLVTTALVISRKTGGNVTEIFDKIAETIRGRQRIERKVRTLTAQGRLQGIVVSAMPVLLGLIMMILRPNLMIPFLTSAVGIGAILAMTLLIALGWLMIRKIIKIDV